MLSYYTSCVHGTLCSYELLANEQAQLRRRVAELCSQLEESTVDSTEMGLLYQFGSSFIERFWYSAESSPDDLVEICAERIHWSIVDQMRSQRWKEELRLLRLLLWLVGLSIPLRLKSLDLRRRFSCLITRSEKCWRLLHGSHPPREVSGPCTPALGGLGGWFARVY
jgi:hypothetical protein